ncbi:hypothetical protein ABDK00_013925 [Niabella insulamsoli]|uniref:hypothetical protein n=1 Tax=Niabella insulamsoli TaxID=3144874 RepID=UPI0031FDD3E0
MALQKIICGPIIRRLETNKVSVWLAFTQNHHITLKIWEGSGIKHSGSGRLFNTSLTPVATGNTHCLQFGNNLWIAVVTAEIPSPGFNPAKVYSYNILFNNPDDPQEEDLLSDKFLKDGDTAEGRKQLAIGYEADTLPSFAPPGSTPDKLNVVHGSCRKMHGYGQDALALLDEHLKKDDNWKTAAKRPQALFLTGDQIYADEVPTMLLRYMCSLDGVGIWSATASEKMKIKGDGAEQDLEADITAYPPTLRQRLVNKYAGFTSSAAANHLLTFEEFCATYLTYWNIRSWNREFHSAIKAIPERSKPEFNTKMNEAISKFVDSAAVDADVNLVNLIRDSENIRQTDAYIFSEATFTKTQFRDNNHEKFKKWRSEIKASLFDEILNIAAFMSKLPAVSRVLANVPTYMIMDDHEVTDDWCITQRWNNQVLSKPFGRDIIRNAMMAYTVFQDWGNTPDDYEQATDLMFNEIGNAGTKAKLLMYINEFCYRHAENRNLASVRTEVTDKIETLLGMSGTTTTVNWHYKVKLGVADALVLDTRTRRAYEGLNSVPELISEESLATQTPETLTGTPPFIFVISPCPVLGFPNFEELIQPAATALISLAENDESNPGIIGGRLGFDYEAWGFNTESFERLIGKLNGYKKVILLSGDVHYGATLVMDYWKGAVDVPSSRIVQLTASSLKNEWMSNVAILKSAMIQRIFTNVGESISKLGWKEKTITKTGSVSARNRHRLYAAFGGIGTIPIEGWVPGATVSPAPEWRWRLKVLKDERPWEDDPVEAEINLANAAQTKTGYFQVVQRHQKMFKEGKTRRIGWGANIGLISFTADGSSWKLKHELKGANMVYEVPLTTPSGEAGKPVLP